MPWLRRRRARDLPHVLPPANCPTLETLVRLATHQAPAYVFARRPGTSGKFHGATVIPGHQQTKRWATYRIRPHPVCTFKCKFPEGDLSMKDLSRFVHWDDAPPQREEVDDKGAVVVPGECCLQEEHNDPVWLDYADMPWHPHSDTAVAATPDPPAATSSSGEVAPDVNDDEARLLAEDKGQAD
jgi:hypothetical protein